MENRTFFATAFVFFGVVFGALMVAPSYSTIHDEIHETCISGPEAKTPEGNRQTCEERTADYTMVLAYWTAGLVAVAVGQAGMFAIQLGYMRKGMADTRAAADAAAAAATAASESAKLARDEFIASHRPRIRISNIVVTANSRSEFHPEPFAPDMAVRGTVDISNVGETIAHVGRAYIKVFVTNIPLPMKRPYDVEELSPYHTDSHLEAGTILTVPFGGDRVLSVRESDDIVGSGNQHLYVLGWINYTDDLKVVRRTAFCRKYDPVRRRFFPVPDPDYEREE